MANGFEYGGATILSSPLFVETILPFLLVFTLVFAILQKSKILGDGKRQIDAIIALVFGLIVLSFGKAVGIIVQMVPFLAVSVVVLLVFMLIWGMVYKEGAFEVHKNVQWAVMGIAAIAVVIALLYFSNAWQYIYDFFSNGSSGWVSNVIVIVIAVIAVVIVVGFSGAKKEKKKDD